MPKLVIEVLGDTSNLERSFKRASRATRGFNKELSQSSRGAIAGSLAFKGLGRSVAFASLPFLGGAGLVAGLKAASAAASDVAEQTAKSNAVFGSSAKVVQNFAKNALGLANAEALGITGTFGALLRPLGFMEDAAAKTSIQMAKLGVDLASFSNTSTTDALDAIRSGLVGESEPLRRYGVQLSEVRVQQEALAATGKKSAKSLTNQEKVTARLAIIMRDTALAQGDFARTSGGLANQQRTLQANIADLSAGIGQALNPVVLDITTSLNKWLGKSENQERVQRAVTQAVRDGTSVIKTAVGIIKTFTGVVGGARNAIELLLALKVVSTLAAWSGAFTALAGAEAGGGILGAAGAAKLLRARLLLLSKIGPIAIGLTLWWKFRPRGSKEAPPNILQIGGRNDDLAKMTEGQIAGILKHGAPAAKKQVREFLDSVAATDDVNTWGIGVLKDLKKTIGSITSSVGNSTTTKTFGATAVTSTRSGVTQSQRNQWFDTMVGRQIDRVQDVRSLEGQLSALSKIAALVKKRLAVTKDITRRNNLEDQLLDISRQQRSLNEQLAAAGIEAKEAAVDVKRAAIAKERDRLARERARLEAKIAGNRSRQFKALGLTGSGDEIVAGQRLLKAQLGRVTDAVSGTFLDTSKTRSVLANIRKVLGGGLGALGRDVRSKVKEILDDINDQLKNHEAAGTKFRKTSFRNVLRAAGLSPEDVKRASAALSRVGAGGTVAGRGRGAFGMAVAGGGQIVVHSYLNLEGKQIARSTTKHQQKTARRNPVQKRGPFAGGRVQ